MPCCFIALIFASLPRVALVLMWLTGYGRGVFESILLPVLGFFFLPYTTCGYIIGVASFGGIEGAGLALVILGVIFDLASYGGGAGSGRYRKK